MKITLEAKTALITGGGRGIGKSIALGLGSAGARVLCAYQVDKDRAEAAAQQIRDAGGDAMAVRVDQADPEDITRAISELADQDIHVDVLVNNAAVRCRTRWEDVTPAEWDLVLNTNLRGPFFLIQAVLPHMIAQHWGRIINVSGIDAYRGSIDRPHVTTSKLGITGLSRAMATETALLGITVNTLVPGMTNTERRHPEWSDDLQPMRGEAVKDIPMGRIGEPEEVASMAVYLASEQASYVTGQEFLLTGGCVPLQRQRSRERTY